MFWQVFNNTPLDLPQKSSIHFFKRGVKPLWEDPRNLHGGAWTFRIPSSYAPAFFREVLMLLIGEQLQDAITPSAASTTPTLSYASRTPISAIRPLNDDICGATYSSRFNTYLVQIWHRDASNARSVHAIYERVMGVVPGDVVERVKVYYKKHHEHKDFKRVGSEGEGSAGGVVGMTRMM
ncbi:translation initiation factor eIF4e [Saitoella complicata NRRL Y-17804]|uniref:translation initiation factor eIF4e n=1 Tax=Saitoella complicata (strain BCRC 22490 / CBS 7301 / JCM 7358 / NBRC 10748 / NRRL Y-17804) TaxID=698492 RepID=UPI00086743F6|nr:translation initiation factor eIF4e [Saitoella complicata NRRL Y-17804]ODQ54336.1 translation initiation factor eIF4e [Saitoella complicata NRRL Y-17804]